MTNEFKFEIVETLRVVKYKYGILTVSKLNTMFVSFDVNAGDEMVETLSVPTFAKGVTSEFKFEIEEVLRDPVNTLGV